MRYTCAAATRAILARNAVSRRPLTLVAVGITIALLGGACTVETDPGARRNDTVGEILRNNEVHWDLRNGFTREEAGMTTGEAAEQQRGDPNSLSIEHPGGEPLIAVRLELPGDTVLRYDASIVTVDARGPGDDVREPHGIILARSFASVDAAHEHLVTAAEQFGIDRVAVDAWRDRAHLLVDDESGRAFTPTVFSASPLGPVSLDIQAPLYAAEGRAGVIYELYWEPGSLG